MAKILLVDDDANTRGIANQLLTKMGHTVDEAGDAATALSKLDASRQSGNQPYALVVSDTYQSLPSGQTSYPMGIEIAEWMERERYLSKMILTSGYTEAHIEGETKDNVGARYMSLKKASRIAAFCGKPYDQLELNMLVAQLVPGTIAYVASQRQSSTLLPPSPPTP